MTGVRLNGTGAVVAKVRAVGNMFGIFAGPLSIVSGNTVRTEEFGIEAGPLSIVSGNTVRANGIFAGANSTVSGNTVGGGAPGIGAGPGSTISGNTVLPLGNGIFAAPEARSAAIPSRAGKSALRLAASNVIGNTATNNVVANLVLSGAGCTNVDNLAP